MAIPREALQQTVDAGHPDDALIALPISLIREILKVLPVATVAPSSWVALEAGCTTGATA